MAEQQLNMSAANTRSWLCPTTGILLLLLATGPKSVHAQSDGGKVDLGGIGVLPVWLLIFIIVILAVLCSGFAYLFWRRHHGSGDAEAPVSTSSAPSARPNRFRESGNWKKRFSRVMKEQDQDNSEEIFRAGTILADLNNAQREAASGGHGGSGKGVNRQISARKPGEPLVTLSPKERPVVEQQQQQQQRSARPSISGSGGHGGADLSRNGTRGGGAAAAAAGGGADLVRSTTRGTGHHPLVSVDVHRKATTRSTRTAATAHTSGAGSTGGGRRDADAHSASSSTGTLNDEHDLLSTFRATGHGDLGLGSGFSNNVPVSSVVRIEDDDTSTVLSSSFPNGNGSFMDDFATSFPQQSSRGGGGRARQSGDLSSAADDYRVTATRSGTVKSHMSKRSVGRSGSQSKLHHHKQRDGSSQPSTSPPRTSAYLLPHIDTDVSLGAVMGASSATIPSPPPYNLAAENGAALGRQASSRSERRTGGATGVDRSRSTRSRAASIYDDEDEREARSAAVDASSRRRRSSRSRTRDQQAMSPPVASRLPRSPADVGSGVYRDEEYTAYADDESGHRHHHHHHRERQNERLAPAAAAAVSRTRSTRVAGDASLSATGVKRSGTSRSTRHHETSGDAGGGVSRSASNAKPSSGSSGPTTTHRTASTRSRRQHTSAAPASDDETPLASVALQALQQSMGGLVVPQPVPAPPPHNHHRRPSKAKSRRNGGGGGENNNGYDDDDADEEDVPLGQLARQASVNGTEIVRIEH
ncbi:hypothetical protein HDU89_005844 [Geranomyces variabilis]|nr:hypothetical protein HDU89_005844 [Geranomyces variabilis]